MKPIKVLLTTAAIIMVTGAYSQSPGRGDICQNIPNLTQEQKQKIDKQRLAHQKTMDGLRDQFYAENDAVQASEIKGKMNVEMANHYRLISEMLTAEQQTWYNQQCNVICRRGYYCRGGFGRNGQGYGRGQGYVRGMGYGRGTCRGRGMGRSLGRI
jgi:Spy/CpxP family protein refolding chaperone